MIDHSIALRFDNEMHELYGRIVRGSGYCPRIFFRMIQEHGGLETARILLKPNANYFAYGFQRLCEIGRRDLTMESTILALDYKEQLFSADERGQPKTACWRRGK